jgi:CHAD domain-containing protein
MSPHTSYIEREAKLAADLHFTLPDLRKIVGGTTRLPEQDLYTTYFDTPDLRLWQRRLSLRYRVGEDDAGGTWTLKLPDESSERDLSLDRPELSWPRRPDQVPEAAMHIIGGLVRRATLGPIAELASTRRRLILREASGSPLGEIDDDIVTVKSGRRKGYTFRQIELEFGVDQIDTDPDLSVVKAILKELKKAGAHRDGSEKLTTALGLTRRHDLGAQRLKSKSTLGQVVQHSIASGLDRILAFEYQLRADPIDPPARAIHQTRVATRRLRSDLKTFKPLLDPVWLAHTTAELKWLGSLLGQIRDADIIAGRIQVGADAARPRERDGFEELQSRLAMQRRAMGIELSHALNDERYVSLLERLAAAAHRPPFFAPPSSHAKKRRGPRAGQRANAALPSLLGTQWRALQRQVHKAAKQPSDRELHRIRIRSKQLRYAAEAATPVMGPTARRIARRAEKLQTTLGHHHDAVTIEEWLRKEAPLGSMMASFAAGRLATDELRRQHEVREQWRPEWQRIKKRGVRSRR